MSGASPAGAESAETRCARNAYPSERSLRHIPGPRQRPSYLLETIRFFRDPIATLRRNHALYGHVHRRTDSNGWSVTLIGPEASEQVLANRDQVFSSEQGWFPILKRTAPGGLMGMDDPEHRIHRRLIAVAFKPDALAHYLEILQGGIAMRIAGWPKALPFYPAVKSLSLDLAASTLLGVPWGDEADGINRAFNDIVRSTVGLVRYPLPGTALARGVRGRKFMGNFFAREIGRRRDRPGRDFFSVFCNAKDEAGDAVLSDPQIIDHMNFIMAAAHDTLSSSITSTIFFLAEHPEWQRWLQEEVDAIDVLDYSALARLSRCEMAFKEAMRLHPPVPTMPRRALKDVVIRGHFIPKGTKVSLSTVMTHRLPDIWNDPDTYDPNRFSPEAVRRRHKFSWIPFGGGAHRCIGMQFAYIQAKTFFWTLLRNYSVELAPECVRTFRLFPLPRPIDNMPVILSPR